MIEDLILNLILYRLNDVLIASSICCLIFGIIATAAIELILSFLQKKSKNF
jgi:hypothetical protein